jgi:hypothetical protein
LEIFIVLVKITMVPIASTCDDRETKKPDREPLLWPMTLDAKRTEELM